MILSFIKDFFHTDPPMRKKMDGTTIYNGLLRCGHIAERARHRESPTNSLTRTERNILASFQRIAEENGMSKEQRNAIIMEGERDRKRVFEPLRVKAKLAFYNSGEYSDPMPDFHIIKSNHPSLVEGGNYSLMDFMDAGVEPPKYVSYSKWVKQGRPIFRG